MAEQEAEKSALSQAVDSIMTTRSGRRALMTSKAVELAREQVTKSTMGGGRGSRSGRGGRSGRSGRDGRGSRGGQKL
jgi:hypothetical protein